MVSTQIPRLSLSPHSQMPRWGKNVITVIMQLWTSDKSLLTLGLSVPPKKWRVAVPPRKSPPKAPLLKLPYSISKELGFTDEYPTHSHNQEAVECSTHTPASDSRARPALTALQAPPAPTSKDFNLRLEIPALVLWL